MGLIIHFLTLSTYTVPSKHISNDHESLNTLHVVLKAQHTYIIILKLSLETLNPPTHITPYEGTMAYYARHHSLSCLTTKVILLCKAKLMPGTKTGPLEHEGHRIAYWATNMLPLLHMAF